MSKQQVLLVKATELAPLMVQAWARQLVWKLVEEPQLRWQQELMLALALQLELRSESELELVLELVPKSELALEPELVPK